MIETASWELGITVRRHAADDGVTWELNVGRTTVATLSGSLEDEDLKMIKALLREAVRDAE